MTIVSDYGTWSISWPWPKIFFGEHYTLGFAPEGSNLYLFEMYYEYGNWHAAYACDLGTASEISSVDIIDFGKFYVVSTYGSDTDGNAVSGTFYRDVTLDPDGVIEVLAEYPTVSVPSFITGCNFNGQCVVGGITDSLSYPPSTSGESWEDLGLGHVWWGGIGQMEFRPDEDRTAGFMSSPWTKEDQAVIRKIAKLGNKVMVYSDYGRMVLNPYTADGAVGFARGEIDGIGVESSNHFAGDDNVHLIISVENDLWLLQGEKIEKLGYREFISGMTKANTLVSYVPKKKRFFISDGVSGYCLTQFGLCSINQLITSAGYHEDMFFGFMDDSGDYYGRIETDRMDFNQRNIKTLQLFEVGGDYDDGSDSSIQTSVKYKYDNKSSSFSQTSWANVNKEGVSHPMVSAPEFKLCVRYPDYRNDTDATLDYLIARIKRSDKRNIRGRSIVGKSFT